MADKPNEETGAADEGVVIDVAARREADSLYAEIQDLRRRLADFESRYRMTFEEFQANWGPDSGPEAERDYWEWSRVTESYRLRYQQWQDALRRASAPVRLPEEEEGEGQAGGRPGGNLV
jgi:hypothetical protein